MVKFSELFGSKLLINKNEQVSTDEHLDGKHVMVYFSAHWCPPCRGFTPSLAEFYNRFQESSSTPFEIVFASSDRDESSFEEYYNEMPWAALPFSERDIKSKLSSKYKVGGIPTLVVLSPDGTLITTKGREKVSSDPEGKEFPWIPKTLKQVLNSAPLKSHNGDVDPSTLEGKNFAIYFSAHWCPPCRGFTPKLVETYNKLKTDGKDFEVIFVSSDRDEEGYTEYYESMPWLSVGFKDNRIAELSDVCEVEGIPQLTLIDEQGNVITHNGRSYVSEDPEGKEFPWRVKPLQKIDMCGDDINSEPCCVGITPEDDATSLIDAMQPIAEKHCQAHKDGKAEEVHFYYSAGSGGLGSRICQLFSVDESKPTVVFLHIPQGYTTCEPTTDAIQSTIDAFNKGELKLNPMPSQ